MSSEITPNKEAILLVTAPLRQGRADDAVKPLSVREYRFLVRLLTENGKERADRLGSGAGYLFRAPGEKLDSERRAPPRAGSSARSVPRAITRSLYLGREPRRCAVSHPNQAQAQGFGAPVLYGCGDPGILKTGGLAVVGSRVADDTLLTYPEDVGKRAAVEQTIGAKKR